MAAALEFDYNPREPRSNRKELTRIALYYERWNWNRMTTMSPRRTTNSILPLSMALLLLELLLCCSSTEAFAFVSSSSSRRAATTSSSPSARAAASSSSSSSSQQQRTSSSSSALSATEKMAPIVSGEDLEKMLQEWDTPLVVDAYATWW